MFCHDIGLDVPTRRDIRFWYDPDAIKSNLDADEMRFGFHLFAGMMAVTAAFNAGSMPARAAELVMLERAGCEWCAKWDAAVAPLYPESEEGKRAPLRRVDILRPLPEDLAGIKLGKFTPTFILMEDGEELGRIRGYPGERAFWDRLRQLLAKLPPNDKESS